MITRRSCGCTSRNTPSRTFFLRIACAHRAAEPFATACSRRIEICVNDVVNGVEADHGCDSGDHAGSGVSPDPSRASLYSKSTVTGDRGDEQSEHEALQDASNDIANEQ